MPSCSYSTTGSPGDILTRIRSVQACLICLIARTADLMFLSALAVAGVISVSNTALRDALWWLLGTQVTGATIFLAIRCFAVRGEADDSGIHIVNSLRTTRVEWKEVLEVLTVRGGPWGPHQNLAEDVVGVRLRGGRRIPIFASFQCAGDDPFISFVKAVCRDRDIPCRIP